MTSDAEKGMTHIFTAQEHPTISKIKLDVVVSFLTYEMY